MNGEKRKGGGKWLIRMERGGKVSEEWREVGRRQVIV